MTTLFSGKPMNKSQLQTVLDDLIDGRLGFRKTRALTTAAKIDLFRRLSGSPQTMEEVARDGEDPEMLASLCDLLTGIGVLEKEEDRYQTTDAAVELLTEQGDYGGESILKYYHRMYDIWGDLETALEKGQDVDFETDYTETWNPDYVQLMNARAQTRNRDFADAINSFVADGDRVLDLGGCSGAFSRALLRQNDSVEAVVADLPEVVEETTGYIERDGLSERMNTKAVDVTDGSSFGNDFDLAIVSSFLHVFDEPMNQSIINRVYDALNDDGTVVIRDYILENDRTGPDASTLFATQMLLTTQNGQVYSREDFIGWLGNAGFEMEEFLDLDESSSLIIGRKPRS